MDDEALVDVLRGALFQLRQSENLAAKRGFPAMRVAGKPFTADHIYALDEALSVIEANLLIEYASVCRARGIEP